METNRKSQDCYFFYYSTCAKGDNCPFRHEPLALGCETECTYWQQGKCLKPHCTFRHMDLRGKNRKIIPCYWEDQPSGCRKPHCPFRHKTSKVTQPIDPDNGKDLILPVASGMPNIPESEEVFKVKEEGSDSDSSKINLRRVSQSSEASYAGSPPVDPVVVNFEEESDNESVPSTTPSKKNNGKKVHIKTLEEIRLEKIQEASAAYYRYRYEEGTEEPAVSILDDKLDTLIVTAKASDVWSRLGDEYGDLRNVLVTKKTMQHKNQQSDSSVVEACNKKNTRKVKLSSGGSKKVDFHVKSLDEIRKEKLKPREETELMDEENEELVVEEMSFPDNRENILKVSAGHNKVRNVKSPVARVTPLRRQCDTETELDSSGSGGVDIKVKTLEQIRAEKEVVTTTTVESAENGVNKVRNKRAHSPIVFDLSSKSKAQLKDETERDVDIPNVKGAKPNQHALKKDAKSESENSSKAPRLRRNYNRDHGEEKKAGSPIVRKLRRFAKHLFKGEKEQSVSDYGDSGDTHSSGSRQVFGFTKSVKRKLSSEADATEHHRDDVSEETENQTTNEKQTVMMDSISINVQRKSSVPKTRKFSSNRSENTSSSNISNSNNSTKDSDFSPPYQSRKIRLKRRRTEDIVNSSCSSSSGGTNIDSTSTSDPSQSDASLSQNDCSVLSSGNTDEAASSELTSGSSTERLPSTEETAKPSATLESLVNRASNKVNNRGNLSKTTDSSLSPCQSSPASQMEMEDDLLFVIQDELPHSEHVGTEDSVLQDIDELLND